MGTAGGFAEPAAVGCSEAGANTWSGRLLMRTLLGVGTPRGLQGRLGALIGLLAACIAGHWRDVIVRVVDPSQCRVPHHPCELPSVRLSGAL